MKKIYLPLLMGAAALLASAASDDYEFYVVLADGNITTINNNEVDSITFARTDAKGNPTEGFGCQLLHRRDGTVERLAIDGFKEVVISDIITDTDSVVDLGLSVRWRTRNLGAPTSADYGDLVGWGDPTGTHHEQYHTSSYGSHLSNKNTCLGYYGGVNAPDSISGSDIDIATVKLGKDWQMPSYAQAQELIDSCQWMWMKYRGAEGVRVTGPNGNSLFLPAAGMRRGEKMTSKPDDYGGYWTGRWYGNSPSTASNKGEMSYALTFGITGGGFYKMNAVYRYSGLCIRPVVRDEEEGQD